MSLTHDPAYGLRVFEDAMTRMMNEPRTGRPWSPAVDVVETENDIILKADLPAVNLDDISVNVENQTLTIKGERKFESNGDNNGYHRIERSYGSFVRSFTLPSIVDNEKVAADYKNGVLTVTIPKKEAAKPRQIKVNQQQ
ncbi:MAG: Hsp20/alpha crystallin family protein [Acidobacteriota bacterium]|nr:Hsp20/alpha crystallin family protein [Acidobacteriota bacterium]